MKIKYIKLISILPVLFYNFSLFSNEWGGWSITQRLFNEIRAIVPEGGIILELGSGWTSSELSKYYTVYSVEHDEAWIGKYDTNYIYVPLSNGWYNRAILKKEIPLHYDLLLIDGPPGGLRGNMVKHLDLFNFQVPMIFDDLGRTVDYALFMQVAARLNKSIDIIRVPGEKPFGVLMSK